MAGSKKLKINEVSKRSVKTLSKSNSKPSSKPYVETSVFPLSKKVNKDGNLTLVENIWADKKENQIKTIVYIDGYDLENLDVLLFSKNSLNEINYRGFAYRAYKTTSEIATAVLKVYSKIKRDLEEIVGYAIDCIGRTYLLAKKNLSEKSLELCTESYQKKVLIVEKSLEILASLNKKNLLLMDMAPKNIFYSSEKVLLSDLRGLRMSVRPRTILDSLVFYLSSLLKRGIITKEDISYLLAYYFGANYSLIEQFLKSEDIKLDDCQILEMFEQQIISAQ
ncbi:MAG: hypothetical protein WC501_00510 [Candidatus Micrarchaeia archaeon]